MKCDTTDTTALKALAERLRKLSEDLIGLDADMRLPADSADPAIGAAAIDDLLSAVETLTADLERVTAERNEAGRRAGVAERLHAWLETSAAKQKAEAARLREALLGLETACEQVSAVRSLNTYDAMTADPGGTEALLNLENARRRVRASIATQGGGS